MYTIGGFQQTIQYPKAGFYHIFHNDEPENPGYATHWHTSLEIIIPEENNFTVIINDNSIVLDVKDILLIAPGTIHTLEAPLCGRRYIILFEYSMLLGIKGMKSILQLISPFLLITEKTDKVLHTSLEHIINKIVGEFENPSLFTDASVYMLFLNFFITLGEQGNFIRRNMFSGIRVQKQNEYLDKLMFATNFIAEHCTENISIDDVAAASGYSKSHFMRVFKQFMGMSCYDYIVKQRIAYAVSLLAIPELPVNYIAMEAGFNSLTTFNRVFKEEKGCTPSEYRNLES